MKKAKITIEGMTCASCSAHVEKELAKIGGKDIAVNPVTGKAFLSTDASEQELKDAVKEAGYDPKKVEFEEAEDSSDSANSQPKEEHEIMVWKRKLFGVWLFTIPIIFIMNLFWLILQIYLLQ